LTAAQVIDKYPDLRLEYVFGALSFPQEVSVEPNQMITSLLAYLVQNEGLTYANATPIIACHESENGVELTSSHGVTWAAERVLICGGYESQWLFPEVIKNSGLIISKLQMMQTIPLPTVALPGNILTGLTIQRYESFQTCDAHAHLPVVEREVELKKWGIHVLFKQAMDGSIILGDSHEYAPISEKYKLGVGTKENIDYLIIEEAERILSISLKDKIARKWVGMYSQHSEDIFDRLITPSIRVLTGIGGKGMTSSAGFARQSIENWI
jgi:FAD dependent oxidoreductase TIGR03364